MRRASGDTLRARAERLDQGPGTSAAPRRPRDHRRGLRERGSPRTLGCRSAAPRGAATDDSRPRPVCASSPTPARACRLLSPERTRWQTRRGVRGRRSPPCRGPPRR
jgi:hypothetical protein